MYRNVFRGHCSCEALRMRTMHDNQFTSSNIWLKLNFKKLTINFTEKLAFQGNITYRSGIWYCHVATTPAAWECHWLCTRSERLCWLQESEQKEHRQRWCLLQQKNEHLTWRLTLYTNKFILSSWLTDKLLQHRFSKALDIGQCRSEEVESLSAFVSISQSEFQVLEYIGSQEQAGSEFWSKGHKRFSMLEVISSWKWFPAGSDIQSKPSYCKGRPYPE